MNLIKTILEKVVEHEAETGHKSNLRVGLKKAQSQCVTCKSTIVVVA